MIETKLFELRDRGTFIPIFAFANCVYDTHKQTRDEIEAEDYLLRRAGFGSTLCFTIGKLDCSDARYAECSFDVYGHSNSRTWGAAHKYIEENWHDLKSGDVIDVEFILAETNERKKSERLE